jgi:hypothetical protein
MKYTESGARRASRRRASTIALFLARVELDVYEELARYAGSANSGGGSRVRELTKGI